jgi:hypothetical protein
MIAVVIKYPLVNQHLTENKILSTPQLTLLMYSSGHLSLTINLFSDHFYEHLIQFCCKYNTQVSGDSLLPFSIHYRKNTIIKQKNSKTVSNGRSFTIGVVHDMVTTNNGLSMPDLIHGENRSNSTLFALA